MLIHCYAKTYFPNFKTDYIPVVNLFLNFNLAQLNIYKINFRLHVVDTEVHIIKNKSHKIICSITGVIIVKTVNHLYEF